MHCALVLLRGELIFFGTRVLLEQAHEDQIDRAHDEEDVGNIADKEPGIVDEIDNVTHCESWVTKQSITQVTDGTTQ
jgi:hypothetical protein